MAALSFAKMHGAGNDFVVIAAADLAASGIELDVEAIARLCDRRLGIGADGLLVVEPTADADFRMTYYNSDGGEAEMCGNGARCSFAFAYARELVGRQGTFVSAAGKHAGRFTDDGDVEVSLTSQCDVALNIDAGVDHPFAVVHKANTGVPHLVVPVDDIEAVDVTLWGRALRLSSAFAPAGTNVNWVQRRPDGVWLIRTYERGVEAETLACGTGASASGLVLCLLGAAESPVHLLTRGGDRLTIAVEDPHGSPALELTGPAVTAFRGEVTVP